MKHKKFSKKLVLNKTTIAMLNPAEQGNVNGGIRPPITDGCSDGCVYTVTCLCTQPGCIDSRYGYHGCILTNYGDMTGCPATMTLCGELYCP
jgi:hypothetical protein